MKKYIPTIGVLVISDNKVLLVKHTEKAGHLTGTFALPAGHLESGESLEDGAMRELQEETGLTVKKENLLKIPKVFYADIPRSDGSVKSFKWDVFATSKFEGDIRESDETIPEWVELSEVSKLNLIANTESAINEGLELLRNK